MIRTRLVRALERLLPPIPRGQYVALSTRPVVLLVNDFAVTHPRDTFLGLLRQLSGHRVHVYYNVSWHVAPHRVGHHVEHIRRIERTGPGAGVTVMGQTAEMTQLFTGAGVDSVWCSQNALADERVFRPLPGVTRRFRALYDARLEPFKRHELTFGIRDLALMGYRNPGTATDAYAAGMRARLSSAHWFFDPDASPDQWQMTDDDVNAAYNACAVGLCLSAEEGANWASIQYLLAGLPVVSTPSRGGRDEFFAPPHVRIVEPTPRAVEDAVGDLIASRLDPMAIRARTLERMAPHRARFIAHVQARLDEAGEARSFEGEWRTTIRHRLTDLSLIGRKRRAAIRDYNAAIVAAARAGASHPDATDRGIPGRLA